MFSNFPSGLLFLFFRNFWSLDLAIESPSSTSSAFTIGFQAFSTKHRSSKWNHHASEGHLWSHWNRTESPLSWDWCFLFSLLSLFYASQAHLSTKWTQYLVLCGLCWLTNSFGGSGIIPAVMSRLRIPALLRLGEIVSPRLLEMRLSISLTIGTYHKPILWWASQIRSSPKTSVASAHARPMSIDHLVRAANNLWICSNEIKYAAQGHRHFKSSPLRRLTDGSSENKGFVVTQGFRGYDGNKAIDNK